jgi:ankyrin repeat protein
MARKTTQRKQETTLVPHRTPNLSALLERARTGDSAQAVKAYLDAGGAPATLVRDKCNMFQLPLLFCLVCASAHPHRELAECVRLLIEAGADINAKAAAAAPDVDECTALMYAVERRCCTAVLDILLRAGADPCVQSTGVGRRQTALHIAAGLGLAGCCELLIRQAGTIELRDENGWTALMHASVHGHIDSVKVLLQQGAEVDVLAPDSLTPLIAATSRKQVHVVAELLKAGADANAAFNNDLPALTAAV